MAGTVHDYYERYDGHEVPHLEALHTTLRARHPSIIFLAGDSSLDNKYWVRETAEALNGYEDVLVPPVMKQDVCYWINRLCMQRKLDHLACLNTAVEATTLASRACELTPQDAVLRASITQADFLVVSIGGNDIALQPLLCTIINILPLALCTPRACLTHCACACPPDIPGDCGCWGCGCVGCLTGLCGWPPGLGYFVDMFQHRLRAYILRLLGPRRPRKVAVCMIYYPDEHGDGWADMALRALGYNRNPKRLQLAISTVFRMATQRLRVPGTEVVAVPLFEALDGQDTSDYVARVEPSATGGRKIATLLLDSLFGVPTCPDMT